MIVEHEIFHLNDKQEPRTNAQFSSHKGYEGLSTLRLAKFSGLKDDLSMI